MPLSRVRTTLTLILAMAMAMAFVSCDVGEMLFTPEELSRMYLLDITQGDTAIEAGARIDPDATFAIDLVILQGAPEPTSLVISLAGFDGVAVSRVSFRGTGAAAAGDETVADESPIYVTALTDDLPELLLPQGLPGGYYTLTATVLDSDGSELSASARTVLLYAGELPDPSLSVYPTTATTGRVALFKLSMDEIGGLDPWLRWFVDGVRVDEGYASDRHDRLAWEAPGEAGFHAVTCDIYPYRPPEDAGLVAPTVTAMRLPVTPSDDADEYAAARAAGLPDPFARLALDGDLGVTGSMGHVDADPVGEPYLEIQSSGYGYALGTGGRPGGIRVGRAGRSLLPSADGLIGAFSVMVSLSPLPDSDGPAPGGVLFAQVDASGTPLLEFAIEDGLPVLRMGGASVVGTMAVPQAAVRAAVAVRPTDAGVAVTFHLNEVFAGGGFIEGASLSAEEGDASTVAGTFGYPAVYDEVVVYDGPYPAYRLAAFAAHGQRLLTASGFEGGVLGKGFALAGAAQLGDGRLDLPAGAWLTLAAAELESSGVTFAATVVEGAAVVELGLDGTRRLVIKADGSVWSGATKLGILERWSAVTVSLTVDSVNGRLLLGVPGAAVLELPDLGSTSVAFFARKSGNADTAAFDGAAAWRLDPRVSETRESDLAAAIVPDRVP